MSVQNIAENTGYYRNLMQPIPGEHPCGLDLEYDAAFLLLQTKLQPKLTAEYGDFIEVAESINWTDTERKCLELLNKARDVRLFIILMRCRMRQIGVNAVQEGLTALICCLKLWPEDLHPQLLDEGEFEPFMRANAFADLEDIDGFIADLRNQMLPKAAGMQISVKEFEKAHSFPREEGALDEGTMEAIKQEWLARSDSTIASLQQAYALLLELTAHLRDSLGNITPDFVRLTSLLRHFGRDDIAPIVAFETAEYLAVPEEEESQPYELTTEPSMAEVIAPVVAEIDAAAPSFQPQLQPTLQAAPMPIPVPPQPRGIQNRAEALSKIIEVRQWFAAAEPSSPVIALLSLSEKTIGKSFGELLQIIPQELISKLDAGQE